MNFDDLFYSALQRKRQLPASDAPRAKAQEQNQIFHGKRTIVYMPIVERRPDFWQIDTTFYPLRGKKRAIFTGINVNTKQGFIAHYSGASPNARQSIKILEQLIALYHPQYIGADNGSEFIAKSVKEFLSSKGIGVYFYTPYDSREKAVIERFNGTVKDYLNKISHSIDANWIPYIQKIVDAYNNAKHSSTGKAPNDMTEKDVEEYQFKQMMKGREYQQYLNTFTPGTQVRIFREADPTLSQKEKQAEKQFAKKDYPRWTTKTYTVQGVDGYKVAIEGTAQRFSPRDLLKVNQVETREPTEKPVSKGQARKTRQIGQALAEIDQAPRKIKTGRQLRSKTTAPDLYKIEEIVDRRMKDSRTQFRVKWRGMPNSSNTWEDATRFVETGQQKLLDKYLDENPLKEGELH